MEFLAYSILVGCGATALVDVATVIAPYFVMQVVG